MKIFETNIKQLKCYIYTSNLEVGIKKLKEIRENKYNIGIIPVKWCFHLYNSYILFSDGERWTIVKPTDSQRGIRWHKCWIDASNVSIAAYHQLIVPKGIYQVEKEKCFNWNCEYEK